MVSDRSHGSLDTVSALVCSHARLTPDAVALLAPDRVPLTYAGLWRQMERAAVELSELGIGPGRRVALALPNGPELAAVLLAISAVATAAPLNPACTAQEHERALENLRADAIVLPAGEESAARAAADRLGLAVIELSSEAGSPAGSFTLRGPVATAGSVGWARPEDVALVLQTSGTTGRPKVVPLTQANLAASAVNIRESLRLTPADRCLVVMPLFHVHGLVAGLLASLAAGASAICAPSFLAPRFVSWLEELGPTWYTAVPTIHQAVLARLRDASERPRHRLRLIRSCSAALPPPVHAELEAAFGVPVIEAYGMTEAAHQIASNPLPPGERRPGSVGLPTGVQVAILDEAGQELPPDACGEIAIRGPGVMAGYEDNPAANAAAFEGGWLRTGDLGRRDADGYVYLTGRLKELINRAGEKIAPREVEECLLAHPAVAQAVAFAVPDPRLGEDVAAAVVLRPGAHATEAELRAAVADRIASFKVPRRVLTVPEVPTGPTGKLQRTGLAARLGLGPAAPGAGRADPVAPRTPLEESVAAIWREVLERSPIGVLDDFVEVGGDSILAGQILARVAQRLGVRVDLPTFFGKPTIAALAEECARAQAESAPADEVIPPRPPAASYPLSSAQEQLWLVEQIQPASPLYCEQRALRLAGGLDLDALRQALAALVARHEPLRTTIHVEDGTPRQVIREPRPVELTSADFAALPPAEREAAARAHLVAEARRPFDLAADQLLRATVVRLGERDHCLALVTHHVAADAWSTEVMIGDLLALYGAICAGRTPALPPLAVHYADWALWQRREVAGERLARLTQQWRDELAGDLPELSLPTDRPRPAVPSYRGAREPVALPSDLVAGLRAMCRKSGVTLFVVLLAGFAVVLHRYTGQGDLLVGCPFAGRTRRETEDLVGLFVNTLPIRVQLAGDLTFDELLRQVSATTLRCLAGQEMPFEHLVAECNPDRRAGQNPLFQVAFQLKHLPRRWPSVPGVRVEPLDLDPGAAKFDLSFDLADRDGEIRGWVEYSTDLFDPATIGRLVGHYQALLKDAVAAPARTIGQLRLLTPEEEAQALVAWNATETAAPRDRCVHELFADQARRRPAAPAVAYGREVITYGELEERSNRLAWHLASRGAAAGSIVGLICERSVDAVVGMLGILKAGAAYLPLDPEAPAGRLAALLADAGAALVVGQAALVERLPSDRPVAVAIDRDWPTIARASPPPSPSGTTAESPAYVMYTSGSTGQPKGVVVPHRAIARLVLATDYVSLDESDVVGQAASLAFDAATFEVWGALLNGARLEGLDRLTTLAPRELATALVERGVTVLFLTTALFNAVAREAPAAFAGLRSLLFGGEAVDPRSVRAVLRAGPPARLLHVYGPTEATTFATWHLVAACDEAATTVPIGRPIANTQVYVLDAYLNPAPIGVPGEIYIGGPGLALGYLNRPELTAERFIPHPFSAEAGARLYRTGDLGRYLPDGSIVFLGRGDDQVKIRGYRVEPGEVEAALRRQPGVRDAVVICRSSDAGEKMLVAHVVPSEPGQVDEQALRAALARTLPAYMVPGVVVLQPELPLTATGKVARQSLPALEAKTVRAGCPPGVPRTATERRIAALWESLLGVRPIGVTDDFFELGGHSLLAVRLVAELEREFGRRLPIGAVFAGPTVERLAAYVDCAEETPEPSCVVPLRSGGSRPALFCLCGEDGGVSHYRGLAAHLPADQPVYGVLAPGLDGQCAPPRDLSDFAARCAEQVRAHQPAGPYYLAGYSFGGILAVEVARQLLAGGGRVGLVALVDTGYPSVRRKRHLVFRLRLHLARLAACGPRGAIGYLRSTNLYGNIRLWLRRLQRRAGFGRHDWVPPDGIRRVARDAATVPTAYPGRLTLFWADDDRREFFAEDSRLGWSQAASDVVVVRVPGTHGTVLTEPYVRDLAEALGRELAKAGDSL